MQKNIEDGNLTQKEIILATKEELSKLETTLKQDIAKIETTISKLDDKITKVRIMN